MSGYHIYCVRIKVEGVPEGHVAVKIGVSTNFFWSLQRIRSLRYNTSLLLPSVPVIDAPLNNKRVVESGIDGLRQKVRDEGYSDLCFILPTNYDFPDVTKFETCLHTSIGQRIDNKLYYLTGRVEVRSHHQYFNEMVVMQRTTFDVLRVAFAQGTLDVYSVWRFLQVPAPNITKPRIVLPPQTVNTELKKRKIFNGRECYVLVKRAKKAIKEDESSMPIVGEMSHPVCSSPLQ